MPPQSQSIALTDTEALQSVSGFSFSGASVADLEDSDAYCITNILIDKSSSVGGFQNDLEKALQTTVDACRKSPLAESMLVRVGLFNERLSELHGFVALRDIDAAKYQGAIRPSGGTALYDAVLETIETAKAYGEKLHASRYTVNGIGFVATDGEENSSTVGSIAKIKAALAAIRTEEKFESFKFVLIGIGSHGDAYFNKLASDCGFDQCVLIGDATPQKLARLADFVSKSISSASQALGTGGASQNITF